ncbi:transcription factor 21 [Coccinella septempunctata]|uniref:transcription factor 21 n=1 Tax=Coccinella septempunctata TaxID=41139 RepID=UPI001D06E9FE|nr:transcription factor 21 [Coccinella septempunctata]
MPRKKRTSSEMEDSEDELEESRLHPQRNAANARERARMRVLSKAFYRLKTTLPWVPVDTKLSKLDTLRLATSYIAHLRAILMDQNLTSSEMMHKHPLSLTWPFSFVKNESNSDGNESRGGSDFFPSSWTDMVPSIQPPNAVIGDKDVSYYY